MSKKLIHVQIDTPSKGQRPRSGVYDLLECWYVPEAPAVGDTIIVQHKAYSVRERYWSYDEEKGRFSVRLTVIESLPT